MDENSQEILVVVIIDVGHSDIGVTNSDKDTVVLGECRSHSQLLYSWIVCIC